jgi:hypothetical protein
MLAITNSRHAPAENAGLSSVTGDRLDISEYQGDLEIPQFSDEELEEVDEDINLNNPTPQIKKHSPVSLPHERLDAENAQRIFNSRVLEFFPEFMVLPKSLKIKIVNFRYFDIKYIVQNFEDLAGPETEKKREQYNDLKGKFLTFNGLVAGLNKIASWATLFAPHKTPMIFQHITLVQTYYEAGCQIPRVTKYSNFLRWISQGPDADWTNPHFETTAYRRFIALQNKERNFLLESKETNMQQRSYTGQSRLRPTFRSNWASPPSYPSQRTNNICKYYESGRDCPFYRNGNCRYRHQFYQERSRNRFNPIRGRGRGRGRRGNQMDGSNR